MHSNPCFHRSAIFAVVCICYWLAIFSQLTSGLSSPEQKGLYMILCALSLSDLKTSPFRTKVKKCELSFKKENPVFSDESFKSSNPIQLSSPSQCFISTGQHGFNTVVIDCLEYTGNP